MSSIPKHGRNAEDVLSELGERSAHDTKWRDGRVFSLVYHVGQAGHEHEELLHKRARDVREHEPAEPDGVQEPQADGDRASSRWPVGCCNCTGAVGTVTSGGTESILCAVAAYRDRARRERPWIRRPELVVPTHDPPGVRQGRALLRRASSIKVAGRRRPARRRARDGEADHAPHDRPGRLGAAVSARRRRSDRASSARSRSATGCRSTSMRASAGSCCRGSRSSAARCPRWDFRVPGVTSISADLHKYGYAGKGASVLRVALARSTAPPDLRRDRLPGRHLRVADDDRHAAGRADRGGVGHAAGARRAGLPRARAKTAIDAADRLRTGIARIPGLRVLGDGRLRRSWPTVRRT